MKTPRLDLTRQQTLAFRRHVGALDERLPRGRRSLQRAAWAGLQDSTWRRALGTVTVQTWRRLSRPERGAVEAEADSLPLSGLEERIVVRWDN